MLLLTSAEWFVRVVPWRWPLHLLFWGFRWGRPVRWGTSCRWFASSEDWEWEPLCHFGSICRWFWRFRRCAGKNWGSLLSLYWGRGTDEAVDDVLSLFNIGRDVFVDFYNPVGELVYVSLFCPDGLSLALSLCLCHLHREPFAGLWRFSILQDHFSWRWSQQLWNFVYGDEASDNQGEDGMCCDRDESEKQYCR